MEQEQNSLSRIGDSFKKIVVVKDISRSHYNEDGIYLMNLYDFLLNPDSLNYWLLFRLLWEAIFFTYVTKSRKSFCFCAKM